MPQYHHDIQHRHGVENRHRVEHPRVIEHEHNVDNSIPWNDRAFPSTTNDLLYRRWATDFLHRTPADHTALTRTLESFRSSGTETPSRTNWNDDLYQEAEAAIKRTAESHSSFGIDGTPRPDWHELSFNQRREAGLAEALESHGSSSATKSASANRHNELYPQRMEGVIAGTSEPHSSSSETKSSLRPDRHDESNAQERESALRESDLQRLRPKLLRLLEERGYSCPGGLLFYDPVRDTTRVSLPESTIQELLEEARKL
ncbi:hypothetical protein F5Y03DRAFT_393335 [Xylaria venustula]|nr:hypothetical protein F5Y03DRAFT_393335 [Xylaria venustula]